MRSKTPNFLYIALGSNLASARGGPRQALIAAFDALKARGASIRRVSAFYKTPAFPVGAGPDYVNAAAELCADWSAQQALTHLHDIEAQMGRTRTVRWGTRTLDLDLISCGDEVLPSHKTHARWRDLPLEDQMTETPDQLILPHPRMQDRAFVLVPLADIAPDWRHPVLGKTVSEMLNALPDTLKAEVVRCADTT